MIIFGTRGVTTTPEKGDFHCPSCNSKRNYALKRVRRFFTLYFIPLIPLDKLGEYIECISCKDSYNMRVLDYDPERNAEKIEAEYHLAIKKVMIHILLADGVIDESEMAVVSEIYQKITGNELPRKNVELEIESVQNSKEDLSSYLTKLQGHLNDNGKESVIKAALYVAMADGEFQEEEQTLLLKIGADLGMTKAHLQGVLSGA
ncbi:MAG: TerB family tellurite resistance protein [Cellvibrionaceae bacterium]